MHSAFSRTAHTGTCLAGSTAGDARAGAGGTQNGTVGGVIGRGCSTFATGRRNSSGSSRGRLATGALCADERGSTAAVRAVGTGVESEMEGPARSGAEDGGECGGGIGDRSCSDRKSPMPAASATPNAIFHPRDCGRAREDCTFACPGLGAACAPEPTLSPFCVLPEFLGATESIGWPQLQQMSRPKSFVFERFQ
jgi:hypothetical protein